ncbi:hypothetical protein [Blastopirellula retiformator]|uniref:Uncharacterized protein n=1 Tax=Blastopirellula retiformator TaxID=2527970 RepID=A0A5C5VPA4_9BACT|nr:hypothetical protein [Blastopirellula retiformator]TWT39472.1 hypothetical protein Enr8_11710 [Blastopirellula retiformator]
MAKAQTSKSTPRKTAAKKTTPAKKTTTKRSPKAAAPKKRATKAAAAKEETVAKKPAGEKEVTIDRRRKEEPVQIERRAKVARRRQIDPTTCERDYDNDEIEFMQALDAYKRTSGRMFPTCSEVLEVLKGLGYQKNIGGGEMPVVEEETEEASLVAEAGQ